MIRLPELLNSSLSPVRRIQPVKASVRLSLTPLSTADMELIPGDTIPERALVRMYTIQGMAGIFRASCPEQTYGSRSTRVRLEHAVCEIGDWTVKSEIKEQEKTVAQAIPALFANYGGTLWSLGEIACTETVILQASKGANVLEAILSVLAQVPGYMVTMDQTVTPWVLGVSQKPTTVSAEGRLSRNITSVTIRQDDSDLCNRVYIDGMSGHLDDLTSQERYGIIEHTMSETGLSSSIAQRMAQAYLDVHKDPALSVEISMLDLSTVTGEPLDAITLGKLYRLAIPQDQLVIEQTVVGISFSDIYGQPNSISVSLANEVRDTVTYLRRQRRGGGVSARNTEREVEKLTVQYTQKFEVSDQKIASIMTATGVLLDANNNPVVDPETGLFVFDTSNQGATLMSRIDQTAAGISSVVSQVGTVTAVFDKDHPGGYAIGDRVLHNGVAYRFTQAHAQGTDWIGTDVTAIPVMQTEITRVGQTADNVYSEVVAARDGQSTLKSRIDQEAGKISQVVTAVGKNGQVTAASIVTAINEQTGTGLVKISADRIELDGTTIINLLEGGAVDVYSLSANEVIAQELIIDDGTGDGHDTSFYTTTIGNTATPQTITFLGDSSYTQASTITYADFPHYHTVTFNNGQFSIGGITDTAPSPFDITATQWYADQVLAANRAGTGLVTIGTPEWIGNDDPDHPSRYKVTTSGRVNASGQANEDVQYYAVSATNLTLTKGNITKTVVSGTAVDYEGTYSISRSSGGIISIGDVTTGVFANATPLALELTLNVPTATNFVWNTTGTNAYKYTYQTDASLKVDGTNTLSRQVAGLVLNPTDAINYGKTQAAVVASFATAVVPPGASPEPLTSGEKYKLLVTREGSTVLEKYYSVPAGSTVGSITVGGTDQGNPSSNVNPGTITLKALASDGTTVLKTATYDKLYITEGGWNTSTNKKAVNIRVGGDTSDDPLIARLWITGPSVSHNISVSGFGTYTGSVSAYTRIGSISAANVNSVRNSGYIVFTVKCGGTTEKFAVTVNA